ncbi:hypothetical protein DYD21_06820 [Rhodohalobacter sp. SW132]|uniref:TlpA family protein disulfide reductase n=1 Tax=Rhodohalobacter sp. SW132 TaxID=2293433 RepID=UPI000E231034|nr:hypothetical protein [Rhodohalobacter sp. SW132]REL38313.1 hypothetical protein DYD21_06820 [Rhodohalobacter sp. SW132]
MKQHYKFGKGIGFLVLVSLLFSACSSDPEPEPGTVIQGIVTVDPELDSTTDYSGIELMIGFSDVQGGISDTLYFARTDTTGAFSGTARTDENGIYPMVVSRNNNQIGIVNLVLAKGDTINLSAVLPSLQESVDIQSVEHNEFQRYERLQRNFSRVVQYINTVGMSRDSVETEIYKWSGLFWDFYEQTDASYAGERSAVTSVSILEGWDNDLMVARSDTLLARYNRLPTDLRVQLTQYYAEEEGLDRSIAFLDQLDGRFETGERQMQIRMEKIELLYDSARTDNAETLLEEFKRTYSDHEAAMQWAENKTYDLATLAPGRAFPEFNFTTTEGETVSNASLEGSAYLLEITRFDNPLYQAQYEQTVVIQQIYSNYGLEIVTIPLATSATALEAFFDERVKLWDVVEPGSFNAEELIEKYNIQQLPTRFLVNDQGTIIKRYAGAEYDTVIQGLQNILTQEQIES